MKKFLLPLQHKFFIFHIIIKNSTKFGKKNLKFLFNFEKLFLYENPYLIQDRIAVAVVPVAASRQVKCNMPLPRRSASVGELFAKGDKRIAKRFVIVQCLRRRHKLQNIANGYKLPRTGKLKKNFLAYLNYSTVNFSKHYDNFIIHFIKSLFYF